MPLPFPWPYPPGSRSARVAHLGSLFTPVPPLPPPPMKFPDLWARRIPSRAAGSGDGAHRGTRPVQTRPGGGKVRLARRGCPGRAPSPASPTWALSVGWEEAGQEQEHDPEQQPESHVCGEGGGAPGCGSVRAGGKRAQSPEGPEGP